MTTASRLGQLAGPLSVGTDPIEVVLVRRSRNRTRSANGEGRNRTGDTTVFSRVLYQLSYLARAGKSSHTPPTRAAAGAGFASAGHLRLLGPPEGGGP